MKISAVFIDQRSVTCKKKAFRRAPFALKLESLNGLFLQQIHWQVAH